MRSVASHLTEARQAQRKTSKAVIVPKVRLASAGLFLATSKGLPMRIRAFIGAAVLGMAMMAFAPVAMAMSDVPPDKICVLDLSQPVDVIAALGIPDGEDCPAIVADVRLDPTSLGGDQGEAAPALCSKISFSPVSLAYRHEDPGRCSV